MQGFHRNLFAKVFEKVALCAERYFAQRAEFIQPCRALIDRARRRATLVGRSSVRALRARSRRLIAAAGWVARTDVSAVASAVGVVDIGERLLRGNVGSVDAIAKQVVRRNVESRATQDAA